VTVKPKVIHIVGARPQFIKYAAIYRIIVREHLMESFNNILLHTGQHYDYSMSRVFFDELGIEEPNYHLGVGSGSHGEQTAKIMIGVENILIREKPDLVVVYGDTNSTLGGALAASKLHIPVAHVEAGLRSYNRTMPEEINRILTDAISDYLFVSEESGVKNLKREGIPDEKIFFVGNVMIDSLISYLPKVERSEILRFFSLKPSQYGVVTLHRPSNVDSKERLKQIIDLLVDISEYKRIVFPIHPRTAQNLEKYDLLKFLNHNIIATKPLGYIDFIALIKNSAFVLTDSGGIQEETTFLGVPCITLRNSTERPVTVEIGTNVLAGEDITMAFKYVMEILNGSFKNGKIPELWDGKASERIVKILVERLFR
jgi:UDP-N-acetylglucosamine 2-epimerase (non-hydrolysing)